MTYEFANGQVLLRFRSDGLCFGRLRGGLPNLVSSSAIGRFDYERSAEVWRAASMGKVSERNDHELFGAVFFRWRVSELVSRIGLETSTP